MQTVDAHGEKVQAMFDNIASGYDRANRLMSLWTDVGWRRRAVADLLPADGGGAPRVLDLCAGTLDSTLEIHRQFPHARIVAGDFAVRMLEQGKRKLRGTAAERIEVEPMDAHHLPLPDAAVNAIFCAFGIRNLSDLHQATLEQARVLEPGGRLVVLEFFRPTTVFTRTFHAVMGRSVLPVVGGLATGNFAAYTYLPRSISVFDSTERYAERLRAAGFGDIEIEPLTFGVAAVVRATKLAEAAA